MAAQSQLTAPTPHVAPPMQGRAAPTSPGRGNGFRQSQIPVGAPAAQDEQADPRVRRRAQVDAYAARLSEVTTEVVLIEDEVERQRAARAVLGQAVEVQDQIEFGREVDLALLPRIPDGQQGPMPFRPLPPEWTRSTRALLQAAGGTGAASGTLGEEPGAGGDLLLDMGPRRSADGAGIFDQLSRIGRQPADYGAYSYQTQSNNLAAPESTCNVTSMAMVLERLGYTRDDVVNAIEIKLKRTQVERQLRTQGVAAADIPARIAAVDFTCIQLASDAWKTRVLEYLRAENSAARRPENYQRPRGATQSDRQLATWSGQFRDNAGMDDLVHLLLDMLDIERTAINSGANPGRVVNAVNAATPGRTAARPERIDAGIPWAQAKGRLSDCLAEGGAAMLSMRHKGHEQDGTHIVTVQAVTESGLVVDDPYGIIRPGYEADKRGDAYSTARGGARERDRKNTVDRGNTNDWQMSAPLTEEEVKGQSNDWSDTTVASAWQYLELFHVGRAPAPASPASPAPAPAAPLRS